MKDRTVHYYQTPADPGFVRHMLDETGLSDRDRRIAWSFRLHTGNTQFYADLAGLPVKLFNEVSGRIHIRMVDELIRLAIIGWRCEKNAK